MNQRPEQADDAEDLSSLARITSGDEDGLVELMGRHRQGLFHFILRYTNNEADAAELTEQAFLKVYRNAHRFKPRAKVRTWMYSIAGNLCKDHARKRARRPITSGMTGFEERIADKSRGPDVSVVDGEKMAELTSAIQDLPHTLKFPLVFCLLEQHSQEECAQALGCSLKTVETRLYRARGKLRSALHRK